MTERKTVIYPQTGISNEDTEIPDHVQATLKVVSGPAEGGLFRLTSGQTAVGRGELAEVTIDDDSMSRRHFQITYRKLEFRLRDLDSSNGTFLNGSEVEEYALRDGDKIVAGETLFVFHVERV